MKRLTAEEVAGKIESLVPNELLSLADLVRDNLIPQWQDEPDGDGWYWVGYEEIPCYATRRDDGSWRWQRNGYSVDVHGRVCPIGARPQ